MGTLRQRIQESCDCFVDADPLRETPPAVGIRDSGIGCSWK
jgi:hypothetical protein